MLYPPKASRLIAIAALAARLHLAVPLERHAGEPLRVGKAVGVAFSFVPLDVGIHEGIFAKYGVDVQPTAFTGDAQAATGDGGRQYRRRARLRPRHGVHRQGRAGQGDRRHGRPAAAARPSWFGPTVRRRAAELKGKTDQRFDRGLADLLAGQPDVAAAGLGTAAASTSRRWAPCRRQIAALKRGDIDGMVMDIANAFDLETEGQGRILMRFGD